MALEKWNKDLEKELIENEINNKLFNFKEQEDKLVYSIDTPPPYLNRPVHIGQATTYAIMDMIARYRRKKGYNVLFPLGLDRNGLPIEMEAEKKFNMSILKTSRIEYIENCKKLLVQHSGDTQNSFKKIGISFNSYEVNNKIGSVYETDSSKYRQLTQKTFIDLYKKGLIYEDEKVVNYCPGCKTTIADSEIDYKEVESSFNTILFTVKETGEKIPIATTRPELICSIGMVIFNPDDIRWQKLEALTAITPLFDIEVPIKAHPIAKQDKGTGLAMMCSAGDYSDIRFFREQGLKPIISINIDGTMNSNAKEFEGQKVKVARNNIIEKLKTLNLVTEEKKIIHKVPICERSKDEVEFIAQSEFYLKQLDYIEDIRRISNNINFTNKFSRKILEDWLNTVSTDWPISRRRFYATEVPLWYCNECNEVILGDPTKYQQPWKELPSQGKCPKCGSTNIRGDKRVLDTWFDSSNTPLYIHNFGTEFFVKHPICSLRPQGKEIVRTWLYYTILKAYLMTGTRIFDDVYVHQHILDEKGFKMSKSKGNVIDPQKIVDLYGAESFRLWAVSEGNLDQKDFMCSEQSIKAEQKTLNKLWNVAKFISQFKKVEGIESELTELDLTLRKEINDLVEIADKDYNNYDFHNPIIKAKYFLNNTLSSNYLELVKNRCYNDNNNFTKETQNGAIDTLRYCLEKLLYILYPIIPFITNIIIKEIFNKDIYQENFPIKEEYNSKIKNEDIEKVNNAIWKYKKDNNISLKENIEKVSVPEMYKLIEEDLKQAHHINNLIFTNKENITF
jgi:valyl-tRNA synthetase